MKSNRPHNIIGLNSDEYTTLMDILHEKRNALNDLIDKISDEKLPNFHHLTCKKIIKLQKLIDAIDYNYSDYEISNWIK